MATLQTDDSDSQSTQYQVTDRQLISRFERNNDQQAFSELVERHGPMVLRVCRGVLHNDQDAEDAFQAVFLVLHRKTRQVRWKQSVANWLYGVAYRIALKGRARVQNRRESNLEQAEMIADQDPHADDWVDVGPVVHQEINRLPTRYRATIVLCCLEGKSRAQAATDLGLSESVVKGRLERGRGLLKARLAKRHLALPVVLAGTALAGQAAEAVLADSLVTATTQAAVQFAAGSSAGGPLLAGSTTLAKGQLASMLFATQIKVAVVAVSLLGTAGIGTTMMLTGDANAPAASSDQSKAGQQSEQKNADPPEEQAALSETEQDTVTKRHLQSIILAVHGYAEANKGLLPPVAVPNPDLPEDKRLSGLVLLLPYLGVRPSYLAEDDPAWKDWHADSQAAQAVFEKIDLKKAWDDPANADAARMIVTEFLAPSGAPRRTDQGYATSHFAFVRGSRGRDNGMFPLTGKTQLAIPDVMDGTTQTLAIGQIHDNVGPWIAAGSSTSRFIDHPSVRQKTPGFGSQHPGAGFFANGDGYTYFWDMASSQPRALHSIAGRADQQFFDAKDLARYKSSVEWKRSR